MRVVVVSVAVIIAAVMTMLSLEVKPHSNAERVYAESGLPNTVTVVYLKNRMYDTLFEVLVFSSVATGIGAFYGGKEKGEGKISDRVFSFVSGFVSFTIGIGSVYLALTGHLYPGGGFTAGVAGGTALLLAGMRMGIDAFERRYEEFKVEVFEKLVVALIISLTVLEMRGLVGNLSVPVQSFLIYLKVMGSTWIIVYNFVKHRGIV